MIDVIDLNADLGESFGAYTLGDDEALMAVITSANIACGFHAGDPLVMKRTVALAVKSGVAIGAHPSFPDLQGFGRRPMTMAHDEVTAMVSYQIGALMALAASEGGRVVHVKPHGALNNMACADAALAEALVRGIAGVDRELLLMAPAGSELAHAGTRGGLRVGLEIFADRAYDEDGSLLPRSEPGAVLHEPEACADRMLSFLSAGAIITLGGRQLATPIHSVCVHGDTAESVAIARRLRDRLEAGCVRVRPLAQVLAGGGR